MVTSKHITSHLPGWWWEPKPVIDSDHHEPHSDVRASLFPPVRLQREGRRYVRRGLVHIFFLSLWYGGSRNGFNREEKIVLTKNVFYFLLWMTPFVSLGVCCDYLGQNYIWQSMYLVLSVRHIALRDAVKLGKVFPFFLSTGGKILRWITLLQWRVDQSTIYLKIFSRLRPPKDNDLKLQAVSVGCHCPQTGVWNFICAIY